MRESLERLVVLDGWRALSALIVFIGHLQSQSNLSRSLSYLPMIDPELGVKLFFGISGFVICRRLIWEADEIGHVSLVAFYIRRVFRIIPPLAVYVSAILLLARLNLIPTQANGVIKALTFTCNIRAKGGCGGLLGAHMWTLSVEEQFYLVAPVLFAIFSVRTKIRLTLILLMFPLLIGILTKISLPVAVLLVPFSTIVIGSLVAIHEQKIRRATAELPAWTIYFTLASIVALHMSPHAKFMELVIFLIEPYLIMYVLMSSTFNKTAISTIMSTRPLQAFGAISYSFYLWHVLAIYPFRSAGVLFYLMSFPACIVISNLSFRWIEAPLIKLGASLSTRLIGKKRSIHHA